MSEASVCLGDSGNNSKYGYKKTNNQGKAVFEEITATQVKATVSKTGYSGAQSTFSAGTDVFVPFNLTTGDQGPVCGKTSRLTPVNKPIKKSSVVHSKDKKSTTITL
ncbi:MAG: hypothetical protein GTO02_03055 [Candidatus Dadabacteria bacterium]|nr:hypothetical protein [Candidatus Dadabacteria bacterium]NIQ13408.1 hypothetical protein [Candidatus Dadabacteria bacterium]